jgi:hypothetical protein
MTSQFVEPCPTCGGPTLVTVPDGHHPFVGGVEAGACGSCGSGPSRDVHRLQRDSRYPSVDELARALHAAGGPACAAGHGAGRADLEGTRLHHQADAEAILAALAGRPG